MPDRADKRKTPALLPRTRAYRSGNHERAQEVQGKDSSCATLWQQDSFREVALKFTTWGCPIFPVRLRTFRGKREKLPLTENGFKDARLDLTTLDWSRANAFGICMGGGFYAIDVDSHKPGADDNVRAWADQHGLPTRTRTHRTPSGGWHVIYRLPAGWENLRTRQNVVPGMDTRGYGGWIAFGEGYEVVRDMVPAMMPKSVCAVLDGSSSSTHGGPVILTGYTPPADAAALKQKLKRTLVFGPALLRARWAGSGLGLVDKSRSAMDHSVAKLLAMAGWTPDEVIWVLLNEFEHGAARSKGQEHIALRAAGRSAVKGTLSTEEERREIIGFTAPKETDQAAEAMRAIVRANRIARAVK